MEQCYSCDESEKEPCNDPFLTAEAKSVKCSEWAIAVKKDIARTDTIVSPKKFGLDAVRSVIHVRDFDDAKFACLKLTIQNTTSMYYLIITIKKKYNSYIFHSS